MTDDPIRTLGADLRDVEAYRALLAALEALAMEMRDDIDHLPPQRIDERRYWAGRLDDEIAKHRGPR
jgi:hypothetical protein